MTPTPRRHRPPAHGGGPRHRPAGPHRRRRRLRTGRAPRALGLRWKISILLAAGCSLVAVAIGLLIHQARARQIADAARASAVNQLITVRKVYEPTGRLDADKVGEADARIAWIGARVLLENLPPSGASATVVLPPA
ncbi:hypothetical protein [Streptomyces subrutilus]|uniref:hypothetical protein n=1 Tax=Streptomyces subrutilus TaxID=36818 RepID=UPI0033EC2B63